MKNSKFPTKDYWNPDNYFIPGRVYRFRTPIMAKRFGMKSVILECFDKSEWASQIKCYEFMFKGSRATSVVTVPGTGVVCRAWCEEIK